MHRFFSVAFAVCLLALLAPALPLAGQCAITSIGDRGPDGVVEVKFTHKGTGLMIWTSKYSYWSLYTAPGRPEHTYSADTLCAGTVEVRVRANCDDDGSTTEEFGTSLGPYDNAPTVTATPREAGGGTAVNVKVTSLLYYARVQTNFYPVNGSPQIGDVVTVGPPWETQPQFSEAGIYEVVASTCDGTYQDRVTVPVNGAKCDCSTVCCVGNPVRVDNGNMTLTETDPLPGATVVPFRRNYASLRGKRGWFGADWVSILDPELFVVARDGDPRAIVSVSDEEGEGYLFRKENGSYVQELPRPGTSPTGLTYDSSSGEWTHIDAEGRIARVFGSDGKVRRYVDRTTNRATEILYTNGRPTAVRDSWGTWSWTVIPHATARQVDTITVDGAPGMAWNWYYNDGFLDRVESPLGVWRKYRYQIVNSFTRPLIEIRDALDHVIERHDMTATKYATSSYGPDGEIEDISYGVTDRVLEGPNPPAERLTRVTFVSGAVEKHYQRIVRGEWRTVETIGGCSSCGSGGSSVLVYDEASGEILRRQDERGFITVNTYWSSGRLRSTRTALRPAGCDPETDANRCRQSVEDLREVELLATSATMTTTYSYADTIWPQKPTEIRTTGVRGGGDRVETYTYDAASGEVLTSTVTGWTDLQPLRQETRTTTTTLYDGAEGAAFAPGGSFESAWSSLPQPKSLRKSVDGPLAGADVTTFVYYPIDASVTPASLRGRLAAVRNAAGHITRYEDYDVHGNARRIVDPNGVRTSMTFDALGRLLTSTTQGIAGCTTDPLCAQDIVSSRTYYGNGPLQSATDPSGHAAYEYDTRSRLRATSRGPSPTDLRERQETTWDTATGKPAVTRMLAREGGVWVEKTKVTSVYDSEARLRETIHADNTSVEYAYDAADQLASVRDENHTTPNTSYFYDPAGRVSRIEQTLATAPGGKAVTAYEYDVAGNLTKVTDPNGNVTTYVYDDFGQLLRQTSPVTGVTTYTYDLAGNLTGTTDALGSTTTRTYDTLGRVQSATSTRAGAATETVTWTYDSGTFGIGRLATMSDPSGSTAYAYDRRGLLRQETKTISGTSYTTGYQYDAAGNRSKIVYPSGRAVTFTHDYANRPIGAAAGTTPLVTSAEYLPFGPMARLVYGNGTTKEMTFDNRYRLLTNQLTTATGALASFSYGYDAAGNITSITDALDAAFNRQFQYDDLNRLTVANSGTALWGSGSYSYDAMGNLLSSTLGTKTMTASLKGTTPLLSSVTENGLTRYLGYDAAGNERSAGTESFTYGARNQLGASGPLAYAYDGRGVRVSTSVDCPVTAVAVPNGFTDAGGTGSLDVTTTPGCTWTALSGAPWLTIGTPASSSVPFTVDANPTGAGRSTTITVGAKVITIVQGTTSGTTEGFDVDANVGAEIIARGSRTGDIYVARTNGISLGSVTTATTVADLQWKLIGGGDVDGDGDADLLWRNGWTSEVAAHVMQNGALVSIVPLYTEANRFWRVVAIGDVSGDGKADIISRNESTGAVVERLMNGTTAGAPVTVLTEADLTWRPMAAADFNGDGRADLLWRNGRTGAAQIQPRSGTTWAARAAAFTRADLARVIVGVGDVDLDGKAEVVMHDLRSGVVEIVYRNGATAATTLKTESDLLWSVAQMADYDGNGTVDVLWRQSRTAALRTDLMVGGSIALTANLLASADRAARIPNAVDVAAAQASPRTDTLGDGRSDIVWRNSVTGDIAVWQMNGAAVPANQTIYRVTDTSWQIRAVGDFNNDGTADLVWRRASTNSVLFWYLNGSQLAGSEYLFLNDPAQANWDVLAAGDFSGDGDADLAFRNTVTGTVRIVESLGHTPQRYWTMYQYEIAVSDLNWKLAGVGDFNGDRHTDLMWHHQNTGQVSIWLMKSRGIQQALVAFTVAMEWKPQRVADFSGDGRADVLWRNTTTGTMAVWEMNGLAIVASQTLTPPSGDSRFVVQAVAGDYNGDGYGDVLWRHTNGDLMSWEMASPSAPAARNFGNVTADWIVQNLEPRPTTTSGSMAALSVSASNGNAPWWTETPGPPFWTVAAGATVSFPSPNGPPFWAPAHGLKGPIPGPPITPPGLGGSGSGTFSGVSDSSRRPSLVESNSATSAVRHSLYTPELNLLAETTLTTGTPTIAHEYVWFAGQPIAQIDLAAGTIAYTFTDHLGTPLLQTDAAANVVWRVEYEPYGKVHSHPAGATRHQPLRFPGQEYDTLAPERAYNIFRWYRGGWGRYTQGDPIGVLGSLRVRQYPGTLPLPSGFRTGLEGFKRFVSKLNGEYFNASGGVPANPYAYGDDSPIVSADPLGLEPVLCTVFRLRQMPTPSPMGSLPGNVCQFTGTCGGGPSGSMYTFEKSDPFTYRFVPPCKECPYACIFTWETSNGSLTAGPACFGQVPVNNRGGFNPGGGGFRGRGATGGW